MTLLIRIATLLLLAPVLAYAGAWKMYGGSLGKIYGGSSIAGIDGSGITGVALANKFYVASTNKTDAAVIELPISLYRAAAANTTVSITVSGTAQADNYGLGRNYSLSAASCSIAEGASAPASAVTLTIYNNPVVDINKTVDISLSDSHGYSLTYSTLSYTIVDDARVNLLYADDSNGSLTAVGLGSLAGDDTTDNTTNFQAIVNWLNTNGGGVLYFPDGTYLINAVTVKANSVAVTYRGESQAGAIIKGKAARNNDKLLKTTGSGWSSSAYAGTVDSFDSNTVTDGDKTFTGLVGKTVFNVTAGYASGTISAVGVNTFTAALTGGSRQDWQNADVYHIAVDGPPLAFVNMTLDGNGQGQSWTNEQNAILFTSGDSAYPGRTTLRVQDLTVKNAGGSNLVADGIEATYQTDIAAYNITGENCGRGTIEFPGGNVKARLYNVTANSGMAGQEETSGQVAYLGLGAGYYTDVEWHNVTSGASSSFQVDTDSPGAIATSITGVYDSVFNGPADFGFWTSSTPPAATGVIDNSVFNACTSISGYVACLSVRAIGAVTVSSCTLNGNTATTGSQYAGLFAATGKYTGVGNTMLIDTVTIQAPSNIPSQFTTRLGIVRLAEKDGDTDTVTITGCSISNAFYYGYQHGRGTIGGGGGTDVLTSNTYNNTGYAIYVRCGTSVGRTPNITVNGGTYNCGGFLETYSEAGGYLNLTLSGVTLPESACGIKWYNNQMGTYLTLTGNRTIVGSKNPPTGTVDAFVGDYYQDAATSPTKQWVCTTAGYVIATGGRVNSVWSQTIP